MEKNRELVRIYPKCGVCGKEMVPIMTRGKLTWMCTSPALDCPRSQSVVENVASQGFLDLVRSLFQE